MNSEEIAAALRRRIAAGQQPEGRRPPDALLPGDQLPTVRMMAEAFDAAPETVHKATRQLADGGLIHTRRGRPAIVADHRPLWIITGTTYDRSRREDPEGLTVFEQQTRAAGQGARTDHHGSPGHPVPAWAARLLGEGTKAHHLWGEGYAIPHGPGSEYVAGIYDCFVPAWVVEAVPQLSENRNEAPRERWVGGVWSVVERGLGAQLVAQHWSIYGAMTSVEESDRFGLGRSAPALVEENCHMDEEGRVLVATRMLKLFGTVRWELELPVGA